LLDTVEAEEPDIDEVEILTDTLSDISDDLKKEDQDSTKTQSGPTSKQSSSQPSSSGKSSSTSSCSGSTAVPVCTQTVILSTSFLSGVASSSTVNTITTSVCSTTTVAGCSGKGTTSTETTSTSGAACTGFKVPTADDPEEDGDDIDPDSLRRRSIAGRIEIKPRARNGPTSFGSCSVPSSFGKLVFPGNPTVDQISRIEGSTQPTDQPLLKGIARYYDRDVTCPDGVTNLKKLSSITTVGDYSMDHVCKLFHISARDRTFANSEIGELKFLLEFFKTITPPVSSDVFTDCDNFNEVFFPSPASTCNNIMQKLYNQVPTNSDASAGKQVEFAVMLKDLNNKKGVVSHSN